ncbi:MAG: hypothetical protein L6V93_03245 [Clostridiales bacterium]|nr:MAG: hypothetical protein L6V93_03245 [Clostridiales bacterium]
MTDEEYKKAEGAKKKPKREMTFEEEELLKKMKELREQQKKVTNLLRAVSIRLPLLFLWCRYRYYANNSFEGFC